MMGGLSLRLSADRKRGRHPGGGARFAFFGLLLGSSLLAGPGPVGAVDDLAAAGAPQLALSLLDRQRPDFTRHPEAWERWLRRRAALLAGDRQWEQLAAELAALPDGIDTAFRHWAATERAQALLNAERPAAARDLLARLIWSGQAEPEQLKRWRELVVRSYVQEAGRSEDAYSAMLRYRQDYGGGAAQAQLVARVLLVSGRPAAALSELRTASDSPAVKALRLLARVRTGAEPQAVKEEAEALLAAEAPTPVRRLLEAVAMEAAAAKGDYAGEVRRLEGLLAEGAETALHGLVELHPDRLWRAYLAYARKVGNREQLLVGDDGAWLELADSEPERYPVRTRSLLVLLALQGQTAITRAEAHGRFAERLLGRPGGPRLLHALYRESEWFASTGAIPELVRRLLADRAIADSDLTEAAQLLKGLEAPAGTEGRVMWELRRAKIFLLGGEYARGEAVLGELAAGAGGLPPELVDRLIQVVFDLQTLGRHEGAVGVFESLFRRVESGRVRRELLYWMADSRKAQGRMRAAAALYLRSAALPGPMTMDPWAQTARYEAAKALTEAGLYGDAEGLYRQLLNATDDPQRRAVVARDLEQVRLRTGVGGSER